MQLSRIPFGTTDWSMVETTEHKGETGVAYWRTRNFGSNTARDIWATTGVRRVIFCSVLTANCTLRSRTVGNSFSLAASATRSQTM